MATGAVARGTTPGRAPARAGAAALAVALLAAWPAAAQRQCPAVQPAPGRRWATTATCCEQLAPPLTCTQVSPALQGGRRNAVVVVLDDFGHCMSGFMGGRCARRGPRCMGKTCSNAAWIACEGVGDCPPSGAPAGCGPSVGCAAANPAECAGGVPCAHGYCRQCVSDGECAPDICVDGLCSPRASCDGAFECARGVGTCQAGTCLESGGPCAVNTDCNDVCEAGKCRRTPAPCGPNGDCGAGDWVCTSGSTPLRLHDVACRYRRPGDNSWEYDRSLATSNGDTIVHTPFIDALAREGAVFPRARGNGEVCVPSRGALLVGRPLRHRNGVNDAQGDGMRQCSSAACSGGVNNGRPCLANLDCPAGFCQGASTPIDVSRGCAAPGPDASCPGGWCDRLHTIAGWLETVPHLIGDTNTIAAGKIEIGSATTTSFDVGIDNHETNAIARFTCDAACEQALDAGQIGEAQLGGSTQVLAALQSGLGDDGQLAQRYFVWYAPRLPHEGSIPPLYFQQYYGGDAGSGFLARTSWLDAAVGGLVDELKRTCVCGEGEDASGNPTGEPVVESLWDNTLLVVTPDNAILLPGAKFGSNSNENAHRHALVVNAPGPRRRGGVPPVVLDERSQFAGHQDVLPTVLDYAGLPNADAFDRYPNSTSLRRFVTQGNAAGLVRRVFYGHPADDFNAVGDQTAAYLVPGPDAVGLCVAGSNRTTASGHVRPCLGDADCGACASPPCCRKGARRCFTRRGILCEDDAACAAGACTGAPGQQTCQSDFGDFVGRACTADRDCVPRGACRPPMLKVYQKGTPRAVADLYDLDADPDQTTNLRQADPLYLGALGSTCPPPAGASLANMLECCFREFWELDSDRVWRPRDRGCPVGLREWTPVPPGSP